MIDNHDDRAFDVYARQPVLDSHGDMSWSIGMEGQAPAAPPVATHPDGPEVHAWSPNNYVRPVANVDGEIGAADRLGYRTGLWSRCAKVAPFDGRIIIAPRQLAHDPVGVVGADASADRLYHGVQSQQTDYTPSAVDVANSFLAMRGKRGIVAAITQTGLT